MRARPVLVQSQVRALNPNIAKTERVCSTVGVGADNADDHLGTGPNDEANLSVKVARLDLDGTGTVGIGASATSSPSKNVDVAFIKVNPAVQNILRKCIIAATR